MNTPAQTTDQNTTGLNPQTAAIQDIPPQALAPESPGMADVLAGLAPTRENLPAIVMAARPEFDQKARDAVVQAIEAAARHILEAAGHSDQAGGIDNPAKPGQSGKAEESDLSGLSAQAAGDQAADATGESQAETPLLRDVRAAVVMLWLGRDIRSVTREYVNHLLDFSRAASLAELRTLFAEQGGDPKNQPGFKDYAADALADWLATTELHPELDPASLGLPRCFSGAAKAMRAVIQRVQAIPGSFPNPQVRQFFQTH
jgi:hypothetical protein